MIGRALWKYVLPECALVRALPPALPLHLRLRCSLCAVVVRSASSLAARSAMSCSSSRACCCCRASLAVRATTVSMSSRSRVDCGLTKGRGRRDPWVRPADGMQRRAAERICTGLGCLKRHQATV